MDKNHIIELARDWVGTPYHHQASLKGIGCDCLGLIHGIYHELYGRREHLPAYSPDWGDANGKETLLEAGRKYLVEIPLAEAGPGDVVAFRWLKGSIAKHVAILSYEGRIIHAINRSPLSEVDLTKYWRRKMVAAFKFKEIV